MRVPIASNAGHLGAVRRDGGNPAGHGFSTALLDEMARADLVIVATAAVRAGNRMIEVTRLRITAAGRKAIQDA